MFSSSNSDSNDGNRCAYCSDSQDNAAAVQALFKLSELRGIATCARGCARKGGADAALK